MDRRAQIAVYAYLVRCVPGSIAYVFNIPDAPSGESTPVLDHDFRQGFLTGLDPNGSAGTAELSRCGKLHAGNPFETPDQFLSPDFALVVRCGHGNYPG